MDIQPIQPTDNIHFGILQKVKQRSYGTYMEGTYKGLKYEVYDAYKYNQLLIYVSKNMNFIKSKLTYWLGGEKKVTTARGKYDRMV